LLRYICLIYSLDEHIEGRKFASKYLAKSFVEKEKEKKKLLYSPSSLFIAWKRHEFFFFSFESRKTGSNLLLHFSMNCFIWLSIFQFNCNCFGSQTGNYFYCEKELKLWQIKK
jgi:hypothetical protein